MEKTLTFTAADWNLMADRMSGDHPAGDALYNRLKDAVEEAEEWEDPLSLALEDEEIAIVETTANRLGISECDPAEL